MTCYQVCHSPHQLTMTSHFTIVRKFWIKSKWKTDYLSLFIHWYVTWHKSIWQLHFWLCHFHFYPVTCMSVCGATQFYLQEDPNCSIQDIIGVKVRSDMECFMICSLTPDCTSAIVSDKIITSDGRQLCQFLYSTSSCHSSHYMKGRLIISVIQFQLSSI